MGHDVDGPAEGLTAHDARCGAFENFDALDVGKIYGKVCCIVPRLGINKGNAVEQQGYLVVRSAVDADVRLYTKPSALSDISGRREFQKVVDGGDACRLQVGLCEGGHLSRGHIGGERGSGGRHGGFAELERVGRRFGLAFLSFVFGQEERRGGLQAGCGTGKGTHAEHADAYFAAETAEEAPALATKLAEGDGGPLNLFLVHCRCCLNNLWLD